MHETSWEDNAELISKQIERLTIKYNKEFFDCKDLAVILGIGRDNARTLMRSKDFPLIIVGNRQVVSVVSFVLWQLKKTT
ncbi:MAG: hypothetical protein ACYCX2_11900 [Christensenellales bacterium]